jgi:hypothetical protein
MEGTEKTKEVKAEKPASKPALACAICGKPTTRLVDGEASCDQHAALVYANQLEDYTLEHAGDSVR